MGNPPAEFEVCDIRHSSYEKNSHWRSPRLRPQVVTVRSITYAPKMTQPSRVIYLPPGVVAPQGPSSSPMPATPGIPFDQAFFQQILPSAIDGFCRQVGCKVPIVEVLTVDGITHYVNGIIGVADQWVALQTTRPDHDHVIQMFVPYQTIFRVEVHPESDERRRHLGFITEGPTPVPVPVIEPVVAKAIGPVAAKSPVRAKAKAKK